MKITLISPNIVTQEGDFFGTGIPYFPIVLAYVASHLREKGHTIQLIDTFGENPFQVIKKENKYIQGLTPQQVMDKIDRDTEIICISAERVIAHASIIGIIDAIKREQHLLNVPIAIIENTQAVTAYSLKHVKDDFFNHHVDYIVTGEPEIGMVKLLAALKGQPSEKDMLHNIAGLIYKNHDGRFAENGTKEIVENPDMLPFPAWDLFKLENYWRLGYTHAPLTEEKYLPILTSRGCPYPCTFCVVPATNKQKWRPRSAKNVVDEMEFFAKRYGVTEYHLEDLNPTIRKERMVEMSKEIINRHLQVIWKIASGTKAETLDEETIQWMAKAGCTYISISPESGSARIMGLMRKPFPYERALELVREMHKQGITTQACFILGYPTETKEDIKLTNIYIKKLAQAGIDEIAVLILTPTPGSAIFQEYSNSHDLNDITKLTFSPIWRKDYKKYSHERLKSYALFFFWRLVYHPLDTLKQPIRIATGNFKTKMEMTIYRLFKVWSLGIKKSQPQQTVGFFKRQNE